MMNAQQRPTLVDDRLLSYREVAAILGVTPGWVQELVRDGRLAAVTLGTRIRRIRLSDVEAFVAAGKRTTPSR